MPSTVAPPVHFHAFQIRVPIQSFYLRGCGIAPSVPPAGGLS